jgi:hypothetical protein
MRVIAGRNPFLSRAGFDQRGEEGEMGLVDIMSQSLFK